MIEFSSFNSFSKRISKVTNEYNIKEKKALFFIGGVIEEESKKTIGHLQKQAGVFDEWKELSEATKKDKHRKGYVFNSDYNPLYRTGDLKESIHHVAHISDHKVIIGSDSEIAAYQELGTKSIPARSFLGLTLFKEKHEIQYILGLFMLYWITDQKHTLKRLINGSL